MLMLGAVLVVPVAAAALQLADRLCRAVMAFLVKVMLAGTVLQVRTLIALVAEEKARLGQMEDSLQQTMAVLGVLEDKAV